MYTIGNPKVRKLIEYVYFKSGNVFLDYNALFYERTETVKRHKTGTCIPFQKKMFITVNGRILQCEKIDHDFSLGYVTDDEVLLDLDRAAEMQNEYIRKVQSQCLVCASLKQCSQCVYLINNLHSPTPHCHNFLYAKQLDVRLESAFNYLDEHPELYKKVLRKTVLRR